MGDEQKLVVISCDPGVTVGWAIHKVPVDRLLAKGLVGTLRYTQYDAGQYRMGNTSENVDRFLDMARLAFEEVADEEDLFAIAAESFQLRMLSSDPELLEPVRFNAVLADRLRGSETPVAWQTPSDAKTAINDARLALWGVAQKTRGKVHGRDAQRHGLLYCKRFISHEHVRRQAGWGGEAA